MNNMFQILILFVLATGCKSGLILTKTNRAPVLDAIADQIVPENSAMTTVNANDGGDDADIDGDAITYSCSYNTGMACTSLPGTNSFDTATGILDWTPDFTAEGVYDFIITGSDGALTDTEDFTITVTNTNQPPLASNLTPANGRTYVESIITLSYTDVELDLATSCAISALSNITVTTPCTCDIAGICTVGVTAISTYSGLAGFSYTVTAIGGTSNTATASYEIRNPFITTWRTTAPNETISLPLLVEGTYNFTVDWGDDSQDTITAYNDAAVTHNYEDPGDYTVVIDGEFSHFAFKGAGDRIKIRDISNWGNNVWSSMEGAFQGCTNLGMTATDAPNLSNVTNLSSAFRQATVFNGNISNWNTSSVENMSLMFLQATAFNQPIGSWDMSSVKNISSMFNNATSFNQDISQWTTSNVTHMNSTFAFATSFNQDIGDWDTSAAIQISGTFWGATGFNQDLSGWVVCQVTTYNNYNTGTPQWTLPKPAFGVPCI